MIRLGLQTLPKLYKAKSQIQPTVLKTLNLQAKPTFVECIRSTTFFNKVNAEAIWKSVNTVSNAGKKRGRGKNLQRKRSLNLYKGQKFGFGRTNIRWPGLNAPIMLGKDVVQMEKLPKDPEYEQKIIAARAVVTKKTKQKVNPLDRGWTGSSILGKRLGPPPVIENNVGFESYVLEIKYLKLTNAKLGKVRSTAVFVVVGNGKGLIGISSAKSADIKGAIKKAQKQASKKLFRIQLEDSCSVNHDFYYRYGCTKLFAYKKPPGYGLVCNRGIAVCCKLLGIKDFYAKVEGSTNKQNVIKAFLLGLLEQKTYQQMADENKLHLVEQRMETYMYPKVLASPANVAPKKDHALLFEEYVMGGLPLRREKKKTVAYLPDYGRRLKKTHYARNHDSVRRRLLVNYGRYESYLTEIYPECVWPFFMKKRKDKSGDEALAS